MIRSMYAIASRMEKLISKMTSISNNTSNMSTPGYKKVVMSISSDYEHSITNNEGEDIGKLNLGITNTNLYYDPTQGILERTNNNMNIAIKGDGYMVVEDAQLGSCLYRGGVLYMNEVGELITVSGANVQGNNGNIVLDNQDFVISSDGTIKIDGNIVDKLKLAEPDSDGINSLGLGMFEWDGSGSDEISGLIYQGYLESSNIDYAQETTNMIGAVNSYEVCQKMMQMLDNTLGLAVNEIGKV